MRGQNRFSVPLDFEHGLTSAMYSIFEYIPLRVVFFFFLSSVSVFVKGLVCKYQIGSKKLIYPFQPFGLFTQLRFIVLC